MGLTVTLPAKEQAELGSKFVTIACCGDSHTRGGYPQELQKALQRAESSTTWKVLDFGACGATASKTPRAYAKSPVFKQALAIQADVLTLLLGTNDAHKVFWSESDFVENMTNLVKQIQENGAARGRAPSIFLGVPPPLYHKGHFMASLLRQNVINRELPRITPQLAEELGVGCFDAFSALGGPKLQMPNSMSPDGVHLNQVGRRLLAEKLAEQVLIHQGLLSPEEAPDSPMSCSSESTMEHSPPARRRRMTCNHSVTRSRAVRQTC